MSGTDPGEKSSAQIEREVEQTRNNVADTLDTLRQKLQPGQMVDQVVGQVSDYVRSSGGTEFMRNLGTSVRDNPMPVALIGAGIAWLLMSGGKPAPRHAYDYDDDTPAPRRIGSAGRVRMGMNDAISSAKEFAGDVVEAVGDAASRATAAVSDVASQAGSAIGDAMGDARSTASDAASRLASTGSELADRAGEATAGARRTVRSYADQASDYAEDGVQRLRGYTEQAVDYADDGVRRLRRDGPGRSLEQIAEAQPLVFGALGLALGAALGAVLPKTEAEDRLMGEARDQVASRLGETAREGLETARSMAGEHLDRVKDTLAETYETTKDRLNEGGIAGVGQALSSAADDVARTAEDALRGAAGEVKRTIGETGPRNV